MVLLVVAVMGASPAWDARLRAVDAHFTGAGFAKLDADIAGLVAALQPDAPGYPERVCQALERAARAGFPERLDAPLRQVIANLEAENPSYDSLADAHVAVVVDHRLEKGRFVTGSSTLLPPDVPRSAWDAGAARGALAESLSSQSLAPGLGLKPPSKAGGVSLEQLAYREYLALFTHAASAAAAKPLVRAGLLDWSRVYCPEKNRDAAACPSEEVALRTALQLRSAALDEQSIIVQQSMVSLAGWLELHGKRAEAERLYRRVLPSLELEATPERFVAAEALFALGFATQRDAGWSITGWLASALAAPTIEAWAPRTNLLTDIAGLAVAAKRPAEAVVLLRALIQKDEAGRSASLQVPLAEALVAAGDLAAADTEYAGAITGLSAAATQFVAEQQADRWREVAAVELARAHVLDRLGQQAKAAELRKSAAQHRR